MDLNRIRQINLLLTLSGALVFAGLWAYVRFAPEDFDQRTRDFAISKIENKVDEGISDIAQSETVDRVSELAGRFSDSLQAKVDEYRFSLDQGIDVVIADILAAACRLDCERREQARQAVEATFESAIARYGFAIERVESLVVGEYDDVMNELRFDLGIFSGSNAIALLFALLLSIFRGRAAKHLLPIALTLTGGTLLMIYWYVFGQDWVMTIIFSDYWGWAYSWFLAILCALMIDIAANRARITSFLFNGIGNAFGSGFSFAPC
ncbi:MAG: hypothetical protein AAFY34_13125 [Pseudomonadota bacterium]